MHDWLCANKLTLNLKMTTNLVFQPRQKLNFNLLPSLILAGEILEKASNIKYLKIVIDHHLSWHDHIDYVCDKVYSISYILLSLHNDFLQRSKHCAMFYQIFTCLDKVSRSINIMTKVKRFLGKHCLIIINIYHSLVYSHLIYGCSLWGNNYDSSFSQLIR